MWFDTALTATSTRKEGAALPAALARQEGVGFLSAALRSSPFPFPAHPSRPNQAQPLRPGRRVGIAADWHGNFVKEEVLPTVAAPGICNRVFMCIHFTKIIAVFQKLSLFCQNQHCFVTIMDIHMKTQEYP